MIKELLRLFFSSALGTLAFAPLLHAPRRSWFISALLGGLSYTLYDLMLQLGVSDAVSMFLGAFVSSMLAQIIARRIRMIATIFVTLSIIPCVPGLGLYRSMSLLAQGNAPAGIPVFVTAMIEIVMIALALGTSGFLARRLRRIK